MSSSLQLSRDNIYVRQLSKPIMTDYTWDCGSYSDGFQMSSTQGYGVRFLSGQDLIGNQISACTCYLANPDSATGNVQAKLYSTLGVLKGFSDNLDMSTIDTSLISRSISFSVTTTAVTADDYLIIDSTSSTTLTMGLSTSNCETTSNLGIETSGTLSEDSAKAFRGTVTYAASPTPGSTTLLPPPVAWI